MAKPRQNPLNPPPVLATDHATAHVGSVPKPAPYKPATTCAGREDGWAGGQVSKVS